MGKRRHPPQLTLRQATALSIIASLKPNYRKEAFAEAGISLGQYSVRNRDIKALASKGFIRIDKTGIKTLSPARTGWAVLRAPLSWEEMGTVERASLAITPDQRYKLGLYLAETAAVLPPTPTPREWRSSGLTRRRK